ncbi:MAG: class I SAM-dependent methyltransferase [Candidatus Falkowbacteria bacterium]
MITKNSLLNIEMILNQLEKHDGMSVADFGCGNFGFFVFPLARLIGENGKLYAVDIFKSALDEIKRKARLENLPQVETIWGNLEKVGGVKIPDNELDAALLVNTLYQAGKSMEMLKETARTLKKGGTFVIVDWTQEPAPFGPPIDSRIKKDKLKLALTKIGFDFKTEFNPGDYHYGLVFIKQ